MDALPVLYGPYTAKNRSMSRGFPPIFWSSTEYIRKWLCLQNIFGTDTVYRRKSPRHWRIFGTV
jgi:hypothetical protein